MLNKRLAKLIREVADKIESGSCELTASEEAELASMICHQAMSKEDACIYLNVSRSKFDELVRLGKIPKGRKRSGFKELVFYKDELDKSMKSS